MPSEDANVNIFARTRFWQAQDTVHRKIKARAAQSGMTLSDYLLGEIERIAALPTRDEMLARLHARSRVKLRTSAAEVIRKERESA